MSWLGDFVGGAADSGAGIIGNQIKTDQANEAAQALAKFNSDLALSRAQAEAQLKVQNENAARQAMVDRISSAQQPLLNNAIIANRNKFLASQLGGAPQTDDPKTIDDLSDEEKQMYAPTDDQKSSAYIRAATNTGDIDPKTVATLGQKSDAVLAAMAQKASHDDTLMAMNANRYDTQAQIAAANNQTRQLIASMREGSKADKADAAEKLTTQLNGITRIVSDMQNSGEDKKNPGRYQQLQSMQDEILSTLKSKRNGGDTGDSTVSAMPMPKTKDALKAGVTYQTPRGPAKWDGNQFVQ